MVKVEKATTAKPDMYLGSRIHALEWADCQSDGRYDVYALYRKYKRFDLIPECEKATP